MAAIIVGADVTKPIPKKKDIKAVDRRISAGIVGVDVTKIGKPAKRKASASNEEATE